MVDNTRLYNKFVFLVTANIGPLFSVSRGFCPDMLETFLWDSASCQHDSSYNLQWTVSFTFWLAISQSSQRYITGFWSAKWRCHWCLLKSLSFACWHWNNSGCRRERYCIRSRTWLKLTHTVALDLFSSLLTLFVCLAFLSHRKISSSE